MPGDSEPVSGVEFLCLRVHTTGRGKISNAEGFAETLEPVAQDLQATLMLRVQCLAEVIIQRLLSFIFLEVLKVSPFPGLGFLDERDKDGRVNGVITVKPVRVSPGISGNS